MPTISLVIPTFNRQQLLRRALDSVTAQTRPPDQIIVVDDGSTDETAEMITTHFPSVHYLQQAQSGVSAARNRGITAAQGDWIALLDSDDEWLPDKLALQIEALGEQPRHRLCHTDEIWIRRGKRVNPHKKHAKAGGQIFVHCLPLCAISPSSVLIARTLLDEVGLFDTRLPACEDYDLWLRICALHPVLYLDRPLVIKHGGHADQLSRQHWGMDRFRIRAIEWLLESTSLGGEDRRAALETLIAKIDVYLTGARKRGKCEEISSYEHRRTRWAAQLASISSSP